LGGLNRKIKRDPQKKSPKEKKGSRRVRENKGQRLFKERVEKGVWRTQQ